MLTTSRLLLRQWQPDDAEPFARLNADPAVMAHFPALLSRTESDAAMTRYQQSIADNGWGLWAVERRDNGVFIGFVGLNLPRYETPFTPCVDIGWRLARDAWGQGFATEAAKTCLAFGFGSLQLAEIVSFTSKDNLRSQQVMQRLGMQRDPAGDFLHPMIPASHRVAPHVLYRLSAQHWFHTT